MMMINNSLRGVILLGFIFLSFGGRIEDMLPKTLQTMIEALARLPGVGERTAERYAYFLLKNDPKIAESLAVAAEGLHAGVKKCPVTFALISSDEEVSELYADDRDKTTILVVEEPLDVVAMEKTRAFSGVYHVLGGALSPLDGVTPEKLHVKELLQRITDDGVREVIIATNPSVEGESTAIFLSGVIEEYKNTSGAEVRVTRLARGLPLGVDIEYADQITLSAALNNRQNI